MINFPRKDLRLPGIRRESREISGKMDRKA